MHEKDLPDELYVGRGAFDVELAPYEINLLLLIIIMTMAC